MRVDPLPTIEASAFSVLHLVIQRLPRAVLLEWYRNGSLAGDESPGAKRVTEWLASLSMLALRYRAKAERGGAEALADDFQSALRGHVDELAQFTMVERIGAWAWCRMFVVLVNQGGELVQLSETEEGGIEAAATVPLALMGLAQAVADLVILYGVKALCEAET